MCVSVFVCVHYFSPSSKKSCYGNYNGVDGTTALSRVLEHNGIEAKNMYFGKFLKNPYPLSSSSLLRLFSSPFPGCCGMPQFEEGDLKSVAKRAKNISKTIVQQLEASDSEAVSG